MLIFVFVLAHLQNAAIVNVDSPCSNDTLSTPTTEHLQLPLFRRHQQHWHRSFGQYDSLTHATATNAVFSSNTNIHCLAAADSDDILVDSTLITMFDSTTPTPSALDLGNNSDDVTSDRGSQSQDDEHCEPRADFNSVTSHVNWFLTPLSESHQGSRSSQNTMRHYYDNRFRPGGLVLSACFGRACSPVCPPAYNDLSNVMLDTPPPYSASFDEPPAYSDIVDQQQDYTESVTAASCAPVNGRLAVRWNSNMRVERWASSVNWITTP